MIKMKVKGLKCDNPDCDWKDESVEYEEYEKWVGRPCPCCGQNVLTKGDFEIVKHMALLSKDPVLNAANDAALALGKKEVGVKINLDGTGHISCEEVPADYFEK